MFMEVLVVELVCTCNLNTLRCLYRQHGTSCAWVKGLILITDMQCLTKVKTIII